MSTEAPSIFLATPCYGGLAHALYMRSLVALGPACAARGLGLHLELGGGDALIGRARAGLLAKFLASPASHLLFVDADIGFAPEAVFRLLDAKRDIVGGVYPAKSQPADGPAVYEYEALASASQPSPDGFILVASVGAGFLLITRTAAQRLADAHPELRADLGDVHNPAAAQAPMLFDSFIEHSSGRYLTDYQAFCHRWRAVGGDVWADLENPLSHLGAICHSRGLV